MNELWYRDRDDRVALGKGYMRTFYCEKNLWGEIKDEYLLLLTTKLGTNETQITLWVLSSTQQIDKI